MGTEKNTPNPFPEKKGLKVVLGEWGDNSLGKTPGAQRTQGPCVGKNLWGGKIFGDTFFCRNTCVLRGAFFGEAPSEGQREF